MNNLEKNLQLLQKKNKLWALNILFAEKWQSLKKEIFSLEDAFI